MASLRQSRIAVSKRRLTKWMMLAALVLLGLVLLDSVGLRRLGRRIRFGRGQAHEEVVMTEEVPPALEDEFVELLMRHKDAYGRKTDIKNIADAADRFLVLREFASFNASISTRFPSLNSTNLSLYQRSVTHHYFMLFHQLYPYLTRPHRPPRTPVSLQNSFIQEKGLVIPVGEHQFEYAVHLISSLKYVLKTKLPILVVHAGSDDLPMRFRAALRSIHPDVDTLDLLNFFNEDIVGLRGGNWAIKPFALLAAPFKEVIICDADAVFFQDPERIIFEESEIYNRTGTYFVRDRSIFPGDGNVHTWWHKTMENRTISAEMDESPWWNEQTSREEMESGVVAFDKRREDVLMAMIFVGYLNTRRVREEVTYKNTYGDKESYWMGFELTETPYAFTGPYAAIIGSLSHPDGTSHSINARICSDHHFHLDEKGDPFWFNGSLFMEKRLKERGFFIATHWANGTGDWHVNVEPWCMGSVLQWADLSDGGWDQVLSDMIGTSYVWSAKFPTLLEDHQLKKCRNR